MHSIYTLHLSPDEQACAEEFLGTFDDLVVVTADKDRTTRAETRRRNAKGNAYTYGVAGKTGTYHRKCEIRRLQRELPDLVYRTLVHQGRLVSPKEENQWYHDRRRYDARHYEGPRPSRRANKLMARMGMDGYVAQQQVEVRISREETKAWAEHDAVLARQEHMAIVAKPWQVEMMWEDYESTRI
jgi:hypothetical protein